MRLRPAFLAILLPIVAAAQSDEWVRDDMADDSLMLIRTGNLKTQQANQALVPGSITGSTQWVMSQGEGPAYVVYFLPGRIEEVEVDTHRLAGASGDFSLAVSTDGKLYQPINTGSVTLDSSFGWDYRLMSADEIPDNATHLLVRFPDGSSAHALSEVWIRYQWDDALAARFLPAPVMTTPAAQSNTFADQSDEALETLIRSIQSAPPPEPVAVSVNIPGRELPPPASRTEFNFKFGDPTVDSPTDSSTVEKDEDEAKEKEIAADDEPKIELRLNGTKSEQEMHRVEVVESTKSGSKPDTDANEEREVVWVPPTITISVRETPKETDDRPSETPQAVVLSKSTPPEPAVEAHEESSEPVVAAERTNEIPAEPLVAESTPVPADTHPELGTSIATEEPAEEVEAVSTQPARTFVRRGPRSKSHSFVSSRR